MSTARDAIVRRADRVDTDLLPEPWSNEDAEVAQLLNREIFRDAGVTDSQGRGRLPRFLLDYEHGPAGIPNALQSNHVRSSKATRWDATGDLVEDPADTLRLQRDPATQKVEGLLYEPKRTQEHASPQSFSSWANIFNINTTANAGSAKGQNYDVLTETNDGSNTEHLGFQNVPGSGTDDPVAFSHIVRPKPSPDDRNFVFIRIQDNSNNKYYTFYDISGGSVLSSTDGFGGAFPGTVIDKDIDDLGGGWYRVKVAALPKGGETFGRSYFGLADSDGGNLYQGGGSKGIRHMHAQAEVSREVTSPILQGGGVREPEEVNYGFSFPDKTTGVAYSIEQQVGGDYTVQSNDSYMVMGFTSDATNERHGALMYGDNGGFNGSGTDGFITVTRNSSDDNAKGEAPLDETIDRFQIIRVNHGNPQSAAYLLRQIAIWTQTLTSAQKSNLNSKYLTQP